MNPDSPPLILVSQRIDAIPARGEWRDALDGRLSAWVLALGALPLPVPNGLPPATLTAWLARLQPQGLLLSGGNDLGEYPARDEPEARLLAHAAAQGLPVLGICRGMQRMATWAGGSLRPVSGHAGTRHTLHASGTLGREVNSFHQFSLTACPPGYRVLAQAPDGHPEAMAHQHLPWLGLMWHPEREAPFAAADLEAARTLFLERRPPDLQALTLCQESSL